ncbi:LIM homeobox transcription factor 1-alpha-like isoform X2 [Paramacrobiotus metropolitanus]|nr:LIM homeobox transcription factor 1-alpha-like isoform X2 [Paramacrobiotus metropolitanus]
MGSEFWHETCLTCQVCRVVLKDSCFKRDTKILCKNDYERLFGIKCSVCNQLVPGRELVMRVLGNIYHLRCFMCSLCGRSLQKGDQFIIRNGQIICSMDFDREPIPFQQCVAFSSVLSCMDKLAGTDENILLISHPHTAADTSRRGPKRPRTILTSHQRRAFKSSFEVSPKPCRKVRESLAKDLGLSVRVVQVWFQNQRAKIKKLQRRQQQVQQQPKSGNNVDKDADSDDDSISILSSLDLDDLKSDPDSEKSTSREIKEHKASKIPKTASTKKSRTSKRSGFVADENAGTKKAARKPTGFSLDSLTSLALSPSASTMEDTTEADLLKALQRRSGFDCSSSSSDIKGHELNPIDSLYSMHSSYFNSE